MCYKSILFVDKGHGMALDDGNIITWNVPNWITVVLMAAIAFGILGWAQKAYAAKKAGN